MPARPRPPSSPPRAGARPEIARLVALSGPLAGRAYEMPAAGLSIGRHAANDVRLRDLAASRRHCRLEPAGEGWAVRDLASRSGTFVNGEAVEQRQVRAGDVVGVGRSLFLLLGEDDGTGEAGAPGGVDEEASAVRFADTLGPEPDEVTLVNLPLAEALERQRRALAAALPAGSRAARELQLLLELSAALPALQTSEEVARRLLVLALDAAPADRAAVLLADRDGGDLATAYALVRHDGSTRPFPVSRTVARRVLGEGVSLLAGNLSAGGDMADVESVAAARLEALLGVPLRGHEGTFGILYLDRTAAAASDRAGAPGSPGLPTRGDAAELDQAHVELLSAMAAIAAMALAHILRREALLAENRRLASGLRGHLLGESPRMREVHRLIARVAPTDATVLIRGESGTGKELVARALHDGSPRAGRPFVAINCATLSDTLLESELFGHEKGAFTGALGRKIGKFEVAHTGTLFLDEIGELPPPLQAKLLRALETREIERVGATHPLRVDVRVVAATNRDLEAALSAGAFRADLFYRLNVIALRMPALRDRREDIPLLANHFAARFGAKLGRTPGFSREARACLLRYDWPGNVRELANAVERALTLGDAETIRPEDLPETLLELPAAPSAAAISSYHEALNAHKRQLILDALEHAHGSITDAARALGLHPNYLHRLINHLELRGSLGGATRPERRG